MSSTLVTIVLFAFCGATILVNAEDVALPAGVKTCKKDTEDYASCMRLAIQEAWPIFARGVPELDAAPLDPYVVAHDEGDYRVGQVQGRFVMKNTRTYGIAKARFLSVKPQHSEGRFSLEIDYEMPKVFIEGDYKAEGSIGAFKIGGKGKFNVSMEEVRTMLTIDGPVVNDRWVIEEVSLLPTVGQMKVHASDLFNGNAELTKIALEFVNTYWPMIYHEMLPFAAEAWNTQIRDFIGKIFAKLSFEKTFP